MWTFDCVSAVTCSYYLKKCVCAHTCTHAHTDNPAVARFASNLEVVCVETIEAGFMTKDLAGSIKGLSK